jgi:hypothetical protein
MVLTCAILGLAVAGQAGALAAVLAALTVTLVQAVSQGPAPQLVPVRVRRDARRYLPPEQF